MEKTAVRMGFIFSSYPQKSNFEIPDKQCNKHGVNTRNYRLVMLHDYNVVHLEWDRPHKYLRCLIGGFIWRFMPDLTFKHRRFMIVDYGC